MPASPAPCPGSVSRSDFLDKPPLWHTTPNRQQSDVARAFLCSLCLVLVALVISLAGRLKTCLQGGKSPRPRLSLVMTPAETVPLRPGPERAEARQTALSLWRDRRSQDHWGGERASRPRERPKPSGWARGDPPPSGALSLPWDRLGTRGHTGRWGGCGHRPSASQGARVTLTRGTCQERMGHVLCQLIGPLSEGFIRNNCGPKRSEVGWEETCR